MSHGNHFSQGGHLVDEIGRDDCVCLVWSWVINQTFAGTPFFHWLVGHTVLLVSGHYLATPSAVRNWIKPRCSSIAEFCNMNTILFSYRVDWTALFIRASALSCTCKWPRVLRSTMKIPIAFLDVWLYRCSTCTFRSTPNLGSWSNARIHLIRF